MKWNLAKKTTVISAACSHGICLLFWDFVSGRLPIIWKKGSESSLCLEARRKGKVFAVIDCRIVVKFDMPRS